MITVFLVDDQALVRSGFRLLIEAEDDLEVVGEAADGQQAVEVLSRTPADVVLMDIRMPRMDGVEATRRLTAGARAPKILILTHLRPGRVRLRRAAGRRQRLLAQGRASCRAVVGHPQRGGRRRCDGAERHPRRLLAHVLPSLPATGAPSGPDPRLAVLTEREIDVLVEIADGASNTEIGERLYLAEGTVKTHIGRLLAKLAVRDRVGLVLFAYETGLAPRSR